MSDTIKLSKVSTEILTRMRKHPEWFMPVGQQELKACHRLAKFGLAEWVLGGSPSEHFGLPDPVFRLTEAGRES
jgi:hypothetical protein